MEFDNPERPECNNLLSIYQLVTGKTKQVNVFISNAINLCTLSFRFTSIMYAYSFMGGRLTLAYKCYYFCSICFLWFLALLLQFLVLLTTTQRIRKSSQFLGPILCDAYN